MMRRSVLRVKWHIRVSDAIFHRPFLKFVVKRAFEENNIFLFQNHYTILYHIRILNLRFRHLSFRPTNSH